MLIMESIAKIRRLHHVQCQLSLKIDPLLSLKIDLSTLFKKQTYRA